ncbi:MAG: hypothetical protein ACXIVG_12885 [Pararhodobacter sp.]
MRAVPGVFPVGHMVVPSVAVRMPLDEARPMRPAAAVLQGAPIMQGTRMRIAHHARRAIGMPVSGMALMRRGVIAGPMGQRRRGEGRHK